MLGISREEKESCQLHTFGDFRGAPYNVGSCLLVLVCALVLFLSILRPFDE